MKISLRTGACAVVILCGLASWGAVASAKRQDSTPKQDMKDAGSATKTAAKKTGSATKKETKKAVHKSAAKTKQGAQKVEDKTHPK
jgi:hypothetical protein